MTANPLPSPFLNFFLLLLFVVVGVENKCKRRGLPLLLLLASKTGENVTCGYVLDLESHVFLFKGIISYHGSNRFKPIQPKHEMSKP